MVLDAQHLALAGLSGPDMLSAHVFASHRSSAVQAVWVAGRQQVTAGRHGQHEPAAQAFVAARKPAAERGHRVNPTHPMTGHAMNPITHQAPFVFHQGTRPLLVSMPHAGTFLPPDIAARLTPQAREVHDTDWHLDRLYDFAVGLGASILRATHSRYVVDLNRPPDNANLYPGPEHHGPVPHGCLRRHAAVPERRGAGRR